MLIFVLALLISVVVICTILGKKETTMKVDNHQVTHEQTANDYTGFYFLLGVITTVGVSFIALKTSGYKIVKAKE
jgi:Na+/H+ antiporter NhaD/arsenite permease-like protein